MGQRAPRGGSTAKLYRRLLPPVLPRTTGEALTCEEFLPLYQHQVTSSVEGRFPESAQRHPQPLSEPPPSSRRLASTQHLVR